MRTFLLAFGASVVIGLAQPTITCSSVSVNQDSTITCTSNVPVDWTLTSGSVGALSGTLTNSTSVTFTPPANPAVHHQYGGCQMFPNGHILNTRIDHPSMPIHPSSSAWLARIMTRNMPFVKYAPTRPINIVDNTTPKRAWGPFVYTPELNSYLWWDPQLPYRMTMSGEYTVSNKSVPGTADADRHRFTINKDTCVAQELYNPYDNSGSSTGSGTEYDLKWFSAVNSAGTDAGGMPLMSLMVTAEGLQRALDTGEGVIKHAVRFTLPNAVIVPDNIWPATTHAYPDCSDTVNCLKYGAWLRLKPTYSFTSPTGNPFVPILLRQLKEYGIILNDGSSVAMDVQIDATSRYTPLMRKALSEIYAAQINASEFEVIDVSTLRHGTSHATKPGLSYATSQDFVEIVATPTGGGTAAKQLIGVRGITVGTRKLALALVQGSTAQIEAWVNGTSNTGLTYTMLQSVSGASVNSSGLITAPASLTSTAAARVRIASAADPTKWQDVQVTFLPLDSGVLRIHASYDGLYPGASSNNYTVLGAGTEKWWSRATIDGESVWATGLRGGQNYSYTLASGAYTGWGFYTHTQDTRGDVLHEVHMPNGAYKVTVHMASHGTPWANRHRVSIETQGSMIYKDLHVLDCAVAQGASGIGTSWPCVKEVPAYVSDGKLLLAMRASKYTSGVDTNTPINAFQVEPYTAPASCDLQDQIGGNVTYGTTRELMFFCFGLPSNTATWSVVSGPGTVSSVGVYTPPVAPYTGAVTVRATSTADPLVYDELVLNVVGFGTMAVSPSPAVISRGATQAMTAMIDGAIYPNVTWALSSSSCGNINPTTGVYSAPLLASCTVTATATSTDDNTKTASATVGSATPEPLKINAGTSAACNSPTGWVDGDAAYISGNYGGSSNNGVTISGAGVGENSVYTCGRDKASGSLGVFTYTIPRPAGVYNVRLMFAEYRANPLASGYSQNVDIQGQRVLTNYDFTAGGTIHQTAVDQNFTATVGLDQVLTIRFANTLATKVAAINGVVLTYLSDLPMGTTLKGIFKGTKVQ